MTTSLFRRRVFLFNALAVGLAIILGVLARRPDKYFNEHHFITWLSGAQLLAIAFFSWQIWKMRSGGVARGFWTQSAFLWLIIAMGFLFLTFDELLQFHENLDRLIHQLLRIQETGLSDRLDDIIVVIYGIIGAWILYYYRKEFLIFRSSLAFFIAGFTIMFLMVGLDMMSNQADFFEIFTDPASAKTIKKWVGAAEDSAKMFAEAVFLVGFHSIRASSCPMAVEHASSGQV